MDLQTLVTVAEDGPWCGTRPPGRPHLGPAGTPMVSEWHRDADNTPNPWRQGTVEVGLYGAITLYQLAQRVAGPTSEALGAAAEALFSDTCGTVPLSVLIWFLLQRPPPAPPWLQQIMHAAEMLAFAQAAQQDALAAAAARQVTQSLQHFGLQAAKPRVAA